MMTRKLTTIFSRRRADFRRNELMLVALKVKSARKSRSSSGCCCCCSWTTTRSQELFWTTREGSSETRRTRASHGKERHQTSNQQARRNPATEKEERGKLMTLAHCSQTGYRSSSFSTTHRRRQTLFVVVGVLYRQEDSLLALLCNSLSVCLSVSLLSNPKVEFDFLLLY